MSDKECVQLGRALVTIHPREHIKVEDERLESLRLDKETRCTETQIRNSQLMSTDAPQCNASRSSLLGLIEGSYSVQFFVQLILQCLLLKVVMLSKLGQQRLTKLVT